MCASQVIWALFRTVIDVLYLVFSNIIQYYMYAIPVINFSKDLDSCTNDGDVRLVNGAVANEGQVEVCTVCDDFWDELDARAVSRELGYIYTG